MKFKDKLPVSYLLFTWHGRINRLTYWTASVFIWSTFYVLFNAIDFLISSPATFVLYPILFWALVATSAKRLHDCNFSAHWLWIIFIPVLGALVLIVVLGFKKGTDANNRFGMPPHLAPDYFKNPDVKTDELIVNDVTQLNPVVVGQVKGPTTVEELQAIIKNADKPVSIGGGRFSMGGQTASTHSIHVDMRKLNHVLEFSAEEKRIKVQAGIRWCDIQAYVDKHNLSVKIMQTYANFTVGGSLSVNVHGRYIGLGPVILSVRSIDIILANGELKKASRDNNSELFFACIGCYNAIAVIVAVEFDLEDNIPVQRVHQKMKREEYGQFFSTQVRNNKEVVFHNGDIYPPRFENVRAVSWVKTDRKPTEKTRLMPLAAAYPLERYFIGAFSRSRFGKWRREFIIDPLVYLSTKIHWRNYEAGYDVAELEPQSRKKSTYVLQEYFAPVARFDEFTERMSEIFTRHNANIINISIRHALPDSGSLLAWAKEEVFAFVVWYKQGTSEAEKNKVAVWTRELIDAANSVDGSYYLPYQAHATAEQFHTAYPNAQKLFELKSKLDPDFKFRNILWDKYYSPNQNRV
ncbi:L-gulonolactone oxidase [Cytophagales bacterium WSM2-2]|nr:L-gulonolactone oxidase [Cytophagales bacterium WSM2-2]